VKRRELALIADVRHRLADGRARAERQAAGIRQAEVAATLQVAPSTVSQWESGVRVPSAAHALAYGAILREVATVR
jgi:transcriptional regulator with XRE-family HTH domain